MKTEHIFNGFSTETLAFLAQLEVHNTKTWFERHRQDYQQFLMDPIKRLVVDLSGPMIGIDPQFEVRPAVNKTISRIHRDLRFSKDKYPFKTTIWVTFKRPRRDWKDAPAYFFEIAASSYRYGMGYYSALPKTMAQLRNAIDTMHKDFADAVSFYAKQRRFIIEGEYYKRIIDKAKPREIQQWYQRKNLFLVCNKSPDASLFSSKLIDDVSHGFHQLAPLYHFLWRIRSKTTGLTGSRQ